MREPFQKPPTYKYAIPINDGRDKRGKLTQSVTVQVVTVTGWSRQRTSLLRRFLKKGYGLTRKQANESLRAMGFDDLFQCVG